MVGSFVNTYISNFDSEKLNELEKFLTIDDDNLYKFYNNQLDNIEGANEELLRLFKKLTTNLYISLVTLYWDL